MDEFNFKQTGTNNTNTYPVSKNVERRTIVIIFEDFKYKISQHNSEKTELHSFPPEAIAKLRSQGLDPETVNLKQLFPETLDDGRNALSLMSGAEWEIMITYAKTRKLARE